MDRKKDDSYYEDLLKRDLIFIIKHIHNVSYEEFADDEVLQDAMCFRLIQISEKVSKFQTSYKEQRPLVPWKDIQGLRNRIVHNYGSVDLHIVYDTLTRDIPALKNVLFM